MRDLTHSTSVSVSVTAGDALIGITSNTFILMNFLRAIKIV